MASISQDNHRRAERINRITKSLNMEDRKCAVIDLLADIRHWCDLYDESFADIDRAAYSHYSSEVQSNSNSQPG